MEIIRREALVEKLKEVPEWDVVIIGGGATGLGIALDSAVRGYRTLLLEQIDFAKGTSSRSTKLVHGGVRYLAQGNIDLVREALYERGLMMKNAPHLVRNQSFIIPNYSRWDNYFYSLGLKFYDFLSGKLSFGKSIRLNKQDTLKRINTIKSENLFGGVVYHDGQFDDSRLAINIAQTCIEKGATLLNHCKVTGLIKNDRDEITGLTARDEETGTAYKLNAKVVINATGVFTDEILLMDNKNAPNMVRPSQGVHLVLDKSYLPGNDAIMIPKTDDGRVLFLVPWHDKVVVGTTDTPLDNHSLEPIALEEEVEFILSTASRYLNKEVKKDNVLSVFAGLRPLAAPKKGSEKTKEISRSHKIIISDTGLITITGGKWTTYRKMALDTINKAIASGKLPSRKCNTRSLSIHGAGGKFAETSHLDTYGSDREGLQQLVDKTPDLGEKIHENMNFIKAEIVWAIRYEMARTVEDILARRVRILFLDARAAISSAPLVAEIMAEELGRDKAWQSQQLNDFTSIAENYVLK